MKTLANCTPTEFLVQTNKIRKSVEHWLKLTDISRIRKNVPAMKDGQSKAEYQEELNAAAKENLNKILDSVLEKYPQETIEVLGLVCFVEPDDVNNHPMAYYLTALAEIINDEAVLGFFTSLMNLEQRGILTV